ncbi:peptide ABC transporter substrate-binding protein [Paenibacillus spiritus]|uniref:Peptide ABC transporter substrate-binding protein n=1 Tax=Paenibacillus spiritus TaxID=2496557 RepID=A0A5J5G1L6_9BACL|nr:peptide ABC transporter substrate-binding protein [Paenibacillus spiritus]KAA8999747.1 peptide ABC transporter substrate-binding protein [Paenibacillus spiritus]
MRRGKFMLAVSMVMVLLAGCGNSGNNAADKAPSGSAPAAASSAPAKTTGSKILNLGKDVELASMDSAIATDGLSFEVIADTIEGLYTVDEAGVPQLAMAEKADVSADGKTITFTIRDAKWSNGTPVTAHDFEFAWKRLVSPETASEYSFIMGVAGVKNADDIVAGKKGIDELGVKATDDKTLVVELDRPVAFFNSLMAFPPFYPINEAFYKEKGTEYALTADNLLANGPFKMDKWDVGGTTFSLVKNTDYYDAGSIKLDGLNYQVIKDTQQSILAYENGDLDYVQLSGEQISSYQDSPEYHSIVAGYLWYLSPNMKVKGLENVNLRKALSLAYDKQAIVEEILKDGSIAADFAVPTQLATGPDGKDFRETAGTYPTTNKEEAAKYWEQAKKELGVDSLKFELLFEDTESATLVAQFIQSEIESALPGITFELKSQPKKNRVELMQKGDYQIGLTRWGPDYADPMTYLDMWVTGSPNNYGFWSNPEYDALINSASKGDLASKPEERWEALKKAEGIVMDQAVIFPVYQKGNAVLIKPNVTGLEFHSVGVNVFYKHADKS